MWKEDRRETDLIRLLGTFALAAKVSKFLLAIDELMQFRHFNESPTDVDNDSKEALGEND